MPCLYASFFKEFVTHAEIKTKLKEGELQGAVHVAKRPMQMLTPVHDVISRCFNTLSESGKGIPSLGAVGASTARRRRQARSEASLCMRPTAFLAVVTTSNYLVHGFRVCSIAAMYTLNRVRLNRSALRRSKMNEMKYSTCWRNRFGRHKNEGIWYAEYNKDTWNWRSSTVTHQTNRMAHAHPGHLDSRPDPSFYLQK